MLNLIVCQFVKSSEEKMRPERVSISWFHFEYHHWSGSVNLWGDLAFWE